MALIAANLIWGTTFVATKPMLERIPPVTLATARFGIALLVLLPLLARANTKPARGSTVALMGFTGVFLSYVCQNVGLDFSTATNGALIDGGIPVFTALIAVPLLRERLTWTRSIGITASLAGVAVIVLRSGGAEFGLSFVGDTVLLAGTIAAAAYFVLCRRAFPLGDSLALVAGVSRYGMLFLLPVSVVELLVVGMSRPTVGDVLGLLYLGVAASALGFALWGYGLRHMDATPATVFANLNPVVGVAVAALVLGESVTAAQVIGGLLIISGVFIATCKPRQVLPRRARIARWEREEATAPAD
jgi:drug/metabolite transporter (DMT)-like permease